MRNGVDQIPPLRILQFIPLLVQSVMNEGLSIPVGGPVCVHRWCCGKERPHGAGGREADEQTSNICRAPPGGACTSPLHQSSVTYALLGTDLPTRSESKGMN